MNGALGRGLLRSYERERERERFDPNENKGRAIGKDHWWHERVSHGGERELGGGCLCV